MRVLMPMASIGAIGGVEKSASEAAAWLGAGGLGEHVDVIYESRSAADPSLEAAAGTMWPVPALDLRMADRSRAMAALAPAVRAARRSHPDVVYLNRFEHLAVALAIRATTGAHVVCHLRYFSHHSGLPWKARMVSRFVAVSSATAEQWIAAGLDARRIEIIPDGIDMGRFRPPGEAERVRARRELGVADGTAAVLYSGRIHGEKGVDLLVDAWERLRLDPGEARLFLLGATSEPGAYERELRARDIPGITWLPARADVLPVLHAADLAVAPSRHESFGRSIVEALATGLPVVATRVEGIPETMRGLESLLVEPASCDALARRIAAVLPWRRDEPGLGARCRDAVAARFSQEASLTALHEVLRSAAR